MNVYRCGSPLQIKTSWTNLNQGRRFLTCPRNQDMEDVTPLLGVILQYVTQRRSRYLFSFKQVDKRKLIPRASVQRKLVCGELGFSDLWLDYCKINL